jgi:hypothetical protein
MGHAKYFGKRYYAQLFCGGALWLLRIILASFRMFDRLTLNIRQELKAIPEPIGSSALYFARLPTHRLRPQL